MAGSVRVISNRLPGLTADLRRQVSGLIRQTIEEILTDVALHQSPVPPSSPGRPPATDRGRLYPRMSAQMDGELRGVVATDPSTPYGEHLEFGTRKMAPRPFMRPAAERARPKLEGRIRGLLK